jgi:hypothetical protein
MPQTTPVEEPTVAINVLLLLHVPPPASIRLVEDPAQAVGVPAIGLGNAFTVTIALIEHPPGAVYVMVAVLVNNTAPPVTTPVVNPTEAIVGLLLSQVPPVVASVKCVVSPEHTFKVPVIAAGAGFTVTIAVELQPVPIV